MVVNWRDAKPDWLVLLFAVTLLLLRHCRAVVEEGKEEEEKKSQERVKYHRAMSSARGWITSKKRMVERYSRSSNQSNTQARHSESALCWTSRRIICVVDLLVKVGTETETWLEFISMLKLDRTWRRPKKKFVLSIAHLLLTLNWFDRFQYLNIARNVNDARSPTNYHPPVLQHLIR